MNCYSCLLVVITSVYIYSKHVLLYSLNNVAQLNVTSPFFFKTNILLTSFYLFMYFTLNIYFSYFGFVNFNDLKPLNNFFQIL